MRWAAAILLALTVTAHAAPGGAVVRWTGAPGGCVYYVDPDGGRWRLGCVKSGGEWRDTAGMLMPGDVVEVRMPGLPSPQTGRAVVEEP